MIIDTDAIEMLRSLQEPGGPDILAELVGVFASTSAKGVGDIRAAADAHDLARLARTAHSLKSSSASLGALQFSAVCRKLEQIGEGESPDTELARLVVELEAAQPIVMAELQKFV